MTVHSAFYSEILHFVQNDNIHVDLCESEVNNSSPYDKFKDGVLSSLSERLPRHEERASLMTA